MSKRKIDDELTNFAWKRNHMYDFELLTQVELFNPYAFKDQKVIWVEISEALRESNLNMGVTDRSCQDRANQLIREHRKGELKSIRTSGISDDEMTRLQTLMTNVSKLEEGKPDDELSSLYSRKDNDEAEAIRSTALDNVDISDGKNRKNLQIVKYENGKVKDEDFEFGPTKSGRFQDSNPKNALVNFLQYKTDKENVLRKEELRLKEKEIEVKSKEVEIARLKSVAEIDERKKMTELLIKLATPSSGPAK